MSNEEVVVSNVLIAAIEQDNFAKTIMRQTGQTNYRDAIRLVIEGKWIVVKKEEQWRKQDGVIYFSVTSDGTTGEQWIARFQSKGIYVLDFFKQALRSPSFKPTKGITTEVAVLKGMIFTDNHRITTKKIRIEADKRKLSKPNIELACLICEKFTNEEIEQMGLQCIVVMHEAIKDSNGRQHLLGVGYPIGWDWLSTYDGRPGSRWSRDDGFAFVVSEKKEPEANNMNA